MRVIAYLLVSVALPIVAISPARAQAPGAADPDLESIIVYGRGEARQVQEVDGAKLELEAAGVSPLKVLQLLPSVNFQSADPFGAYEWSTRITIRGFSQNQLGFTLDEVPLGDMSYGNHNGLHLSRATISENVGRILVSQGAGAVRTASSSNLGGTLEFTTRAPKETFGAEGSVSYGSENSWRVFARIDSGELAEGGPRLFVSGAFSDADKWKGDGIQRHTLVNARVEQQIGDGKFTAFVNYSNRKENDYQDLSQEMIARLGLEWDNFAPDWATAVRVAQIAANRGDTFAGNYPGVGTTYPAPIRTADDAYYDASGLRKDWLYSAQIDVPVSETFRVKLIGYGHNNEGQGIWFTPYQVSPSGLPISVRTTEYDIARYGAVGRVSATFDAFDVEAGFWFERNGFEQARRFYGLDNTTTGPSRSSTEFQRNPFRTQWLYDFTTTTRQFYVQGAYRGEGFGVFAGVKALRVKNEVETLGGDRAIDFTLGGTVEPEIVASKNFLPQVGFTFDTADVGQVFATYARNMRAFVSAATAGPFATSANGFRAIRDRLEPETTDTFELGWRFNVDRISGVIGLYQVNFKDRILSVSTGPGIVGSPSALQNVGDVRSRGVETAITGRVTDDISITGSYSYNSNTYRDDVIDGNGNRVPTAGRTVVDSPKHLLKAEFAYDNGVVFAKADLNHMSSRYFTYLNDRRVNSQTLVNASLGVRFGQWLDIDDDSVALQLNITNLFGLDYVSTIGSNGFGNSGDNQTLLAGTPRQIFVSLRGKF
jgi:iron complex outermembrane recepter protein